MIFVGLDLSVNSTGVCVNEDGRDRYVIVTGKAKRCHAERNGLPVEVVAYGKDAGDDKEIGKTRNILRAADRIMEAVPDGTALAVLEGISYGSRGSAAICDLAGLGHHVRCELERRGIPWAVVPPTSLKKYACGLSGADKETMTRAWLWTMPEAERAAWEGLARAGWKLDDIADARFLCRWGMENGQNPGI